ncbi:phage holin family protein [Gordonia alkaliphila]|uniref:Phage holin family protein n=1 Tax=Gordonia alkaliphila TaxID=1053547 RepID=A0ABP8YZ92_9ACTN|nr:phage holin family protein [Gordonia alkaliphila]MCK0439269.1 phage holin family protein [Gordonia alkaliphila]
MSGNQDTWPSEPKNAPQVPSIPMSDANLGADGQPTIGNLVKDATASASTLFRAEVALAKRELIGEAKKAGAGTGLLVGAAVLLLYASLFFFVFLGFLLDVWLPTWAAFLIVFAILMAVSIGAIIVGYILFRRLRKPEKTIESVKETVAILPGRGAPADPHGTAHAHPQIPAAHDPSRS